MKKLLYLLIIINSQICFAQIGLGINADTFFERLYFKSNQYEYKDIQGSPYLKAEFQPAQIGNDYKNIPTRYNSYTDSFEFQQDGSTYVVPKEDNLSKIVFQNFGDTFILFDLNGSKTYLQEIDKEAGVYKKITTVFREFKKATSSYVDDTPPSFERQAPKYYLLNNGNLIEVTKKNLYNNFPDKEKALKEFIKKNNLSFEKEFDLVKIASFLKK